MSASDRSVCRLGVLVLNWHKFLRVHAHPLSMRALARLQNGNRVGPWNKLPG